MKITINSLERLLEVSHYDHVVLVLEADYRTVVDDVYQAARENGCYVSAGQSDIDGWAEATWNTKRPKRGQAGTTQGDYAAIVTNLSSNTHNWDGISTLTTFTIN